MTLAAAGWAVAAYEHGFAHFMGIDTQQSQNYDFVSGVGPMLITAIGLSTLIAGAFRHFNCHVNGCPRIGRYPVAGGHFKVCRVHHPDEAVRDGNVSRHHILQAHLRHLGRTP